MAIDANELIGSIADRALGIDGARVGAYTVCDLIWLANVGLLLPTVPSEPKAESPRNDSDDSQGFDDEDRNDEVDIGDDETLSPGSSSLLKNVPQTLNVKVPDGGVAIESPKHMRVQSAPAIGRRLAIERAFRGLRLRRAMHGTGKELDENATVDACSATNIWIPQWRAASGRWLDLVIVSEKSASMSVWDGVSQELAQIAGRATGARSVRSLELERVRGDGNPSGRVRLTEAGREKRSIDLYKGRSLLLYVTDAFGEGWLTGEVPRLLAELSRRAPVLVIMTLPRHLWSRTCLEAILPLARIAANGGTLATDVLPAVPLLTYFDAAPIARTIDFVAGRRDATALCLFPANDLKNRSAFEFGELFAEIDPTDLDTMRLIDASSEIDIDDLYESFRQTASAPTRQLAYFLAELPLLLPVMRLMEHALIEHAAPWLIAELFLSGIVRRRRKTSISDPDVFEFLPGLASHLVAEAGSDVLDRSMRVLEDRHNELPPPARDIVSQFLNARRSRGADFVVHYGGVNDKADLPHEFASFAETTDDVKQVARGDDEAEDIAIDDSETETGMAPRVELWERIVSELAVDHESGEPPLSITLLNARYDSRRLELFAPSIDVERHVRRAYLEAIGELARKFEPALISITLSSFADISELLSPAFERAAVGAVEFESGLDPAVTFGTIPAGGLAAHVARLAALHLGTYSPVYLFGDPRDVLRLLHATGNQFAEKKPELRIRCVDAVDFVVELSGARAMGSSAMLLNFYGSLDVLLVGNVQHLAQSTTEQSEFIDVIDMICDGRRQLVLSSSCRLDSANFHPGIVSRLRRGIVVDAWSSFDPQLPKLISSNCARTFGFRITDEAAGFVAVNCEARGIDWNDCIKEIYFRVRSKRASVADISIVRDALAAQVERPRSDVAPESILEIVCGYYGLKINELRRAGKSRKVGHARKMAIFLLLDLAPNGLREVQNYFDGVGRVEQLALRAGMDKRLREDARTREEWFQLRDRIRGHHGLPKGTSRTGVFVVDRLVSNASLANRSKGPDTTRAVCQALLRVYNAAGGPNLLARVLANNRFADFKEVEKLGVASNRDIAYFGLLLHHLGLCSLKLVVHRFSAFIRAAASESDRLELANLYLLANMYSQVKATVETILGADVKNAFVASIAYFLRARVSIARGYKSAALRDLERAMRFSTTELSGSPSGVIPSRYAVETLLMEISDAYEDIGESGRAAIVLYRATKSRKSAVASPDNRDALMNIAVRLERRGYGERHQEHWHAAVQTFTECKEIAARVLKEDPASVDARNLFVTSCKNLGMAMAKVATGASEAIQIIKEGLMHCSPLSRFDLKAPQLQRDLYRMLTRIRADAGDLVGALDAGRRCVSLCRDLALEYPENHRAARDIVIASNTLASLKEQDNDVEAALRIYEENLVWCQARPGLYSSREALHDVVFLSGKIAMLSERLVDVARARGAYDNELDAGESLLAFTPSDVRLRRKIIGSYLARFRIAEAENDATKRRDCFRRLKANLMELEVRGALLTPEDRELRDWVHHGLRAN